MASSAGAALGTEQNLIEFNSSKALPLFWTLFESYVTCLDRWKIICYLFFEDITRTFTTLVNLF